MDPTRLLDAPRSDLARRGGLERDLLRSARTEVAPEATRARVLRTVDRVLATSAALQRAGAARTSVASSTSLGTKFALALKSLNALYLGASLTAAAAVGVVIHQWAATTATGRASPDREHASTRATEPAPTHRSISQAPASAVAPPVTPPEPATAVAAMSRVEQGGGEQGRGEQGRGEQGRGEQGRGEQGRGEQGRGEQGRGEQGRGEQGRGEQSGMQPGPLANTSARASRLHAIEAAHSSRSKPHQEEEPADWLGAQLQLLGEAREQLETGRLEQASEVLGSYERRFPGGVIGLQIRVLRAELRERLAQKRLAESGGEP